MDPFTERMLARSRARRERQESQNPDVNKNSELEATRQRNPLQDQKQLQLVKVTTEVEVALTKSGKEQISSSVRVIPKKCDPVITASEDSEDDVAKENVEVNSPEPKPDTTSAMRETARSRLRRLGALYADSQLSSPIHQTEGSFNAEQDERSESVQQPPLKSGKTGARLARLAVLADTIKHWEDDLSHPALAANHDKLSPDKLRRIEDEHASGSDEETAEFLQDQTKKRTLDVIKPRQVVWDQNVIAALEAQGYSRTKSNSRLVYDYSKNSSQDDDKEDAATTTDSLNKLSTIQKGEHSANKESESSNSMKGTSASGGISNLHSISSSKLHTSPEKRITSVNSSGSPRAPGVPQMGLRVRSPHKGDVSPKSGSVLHKAALFESNSPTMKNGKDPTELSVSERLALFERNKGQALIPKAAFSMPVPPKYLDSKDDSKNKTNSPGKVTARTVGGIISQLQKDTYEKPKTEIPAKASPGKSVGKAVENTIMQMQKSTVAQIPDCKNDVPISSSRALAQMFEQGNVITADKSIVRNAQSERQKDMEMLLNRWNKNKEMSSGETNINTHTEEKKIQPEPKRKQELMGPPIPPPLPGTPGLSQQHFNIRPENSSVPHQHSSSSNKSPLKNQSVPKTSNPNAAPEKMYKVQKVNQQYAGLTDMRKIKVSPPKPGRLYPCLSDIETATETESEVQDDYNQSIFDDMDSSGSTIGETSFGREILQAAGIDSSLKHQQQQVQAESSDDESDMESAVLEEIDDFLDEALGDDSDSEESPSPPKKTKDSSRSPQRIYIDKGRKKSYCSPTSAQSHSFKYSKGQTYSEIDSSSTSTSEDHIPSYVVEGSEQIPLMHTVSFYRRQQNLAVKGTPVRQIVRHIDIEQKNTTTSQTKTDDGSRKRKKIGQLVDEASKQLTVISQATQALNLCSATVEFSGSAEEVEGERLLLLATHRRQAALDEIQQLQMEAALKQPSDNNSEFSEKGSLLITDITLPLKKEYIRALAAAEQCHHFVCLVRAQEQVMATSVLAASSENLRRSGGASLQFPGSLKLEGLCSNFRAKLEIYSLQTHREVLPHDIKYHIAGKKDGNTNKLRLTPKKLLKQDSRLIMPTIQSPAGPSAVRAPAFQMCGFVVFSLREVKRTQFTLNNVAYSSPLAGNIQLKLNSELELDVGERGFLTMFEDVSGFGAWHRRWCLLEGAMLSYWKYPDDEKKKVPIGQMDLNICTTDSVGLVSRDICARPHTFLLETRRPSRPDDEDSLVLIRCGSQTIIRHLLSADTRDDRIAWCTQINKALAMLRMWGNKISH